MGGLGLARVLSHSYFIPCFLRVVDNAISWLSRQGNRPVSYSVTSKASSGSRQEEMQTHIQILLRESLEHTDLKETSPSNPSRQRSRGPMEEEVDGGHQENKAL